MGSARAEHMVELEVEGDREVGVEVQVVPSAT